MVARSKLARWQVDENLREMIEKLHMARTRKVLEFVVAAAIAGPEALDNACFELVGPRRRAGMADSRLALHAASLLFVHFVEREFARCVGSC